MIFVYFLIFVLGLCLGSFANVLIWRLPKNKSILGRSICPNCKKQIAWYDNFPLIPYFFLSGKCRNCKEKISIRYPLVELISGLLVLAGFFALPLKYFLGYALLTPLLISIFVIDIKYQIIPDELIFAGLVIAVLFFPLSSGFFAGLAASLILLILHLISRGRGMGLGDVKFAVLGGMIVGAQDFLNWLFVAFLTGAAVGVILILSKNAKLKDKIAFGPFLVFALFLIILTGL
jgi:leader peptidase (prepilin peptidase)/N-methyltransferase